MPGETDAQRFSNCPKSYVLKLETPGGPTSILNGKRGILLLFSHVAQQSWERLECWVIFFQPALALLLRNHVGQDSNRVAEH